MTGIRERSENIRRFILDNVTHHRRDIAARTSTVYGITRQAVNIHIRHLIKQGALLEFGVTRNKQYALPALTKWQHTYSLGALAEDVVWRADILGFITGLPGNVMDIWQYGFTKILNNVIDHSSGTRVHVRVMKTAAEIEISICDDGEGIFKKIQRELKLSDERHSVLELAKGKLTTDPDNHTGEGIFFSSRMVDDFQILSGNVYFSHQHNRAKDWIMEKQKFQSGTSVLMKLSNNSARVLKDVFDGFTSDNEYGFTKTVVPVRLAQYGDDKLVSRSQAKRVLVRIEKFKTVVFDFESVETIGQAFADEIFRVFKSRQPDIELIHLNANKQVTQMIMRALS